MATQVTNVNQIKSGLCPHGLPPGACPICSNMGGGGGMRAGERPQKAGEMSYHECVMAGLAMKAKESANKQHAQNIIQRAEIIKTFQADLEKASAKMLEFAQNISANIALKPIAFAIQNIFVPIINLAKNITVFVQNTINFIKETFINISDKLNAIYGEVKAFIDKKMSDIAGAIKTKFIYLFRILKKHNAKDDDTKIDDDKKIFNLKNMLHKIIRKKKENDRDNKNK